MTFLRLQQVAIKRADKLAPRLGQTSSTQLIVKKHFKSMQHTKGQKARAMRKMKASMKKLRLEMKEIGEEQKSIREGQRQHDKTTIFPEPLLSLKLFVTILRSRARTNEIALMGNCCSVLIEIKRRSRNGSVEVHSLKR
ncbi:hypothetical protein SLA2020_359710 [Shorea laevis]